MEKVLGLKFLEYDVEIFFLTCCTRKNIIIVKNNLCLFTFILVESKIEYATSMCIYSKLRILLFKL